jgi:type IV secretion system protein VirB6
MDDGGLAALLRSVDCHTGEATALAFGRLFGPHGALLPVLTGVLTLYVAIFAIGLMTGHARLGGGLTPRMLTIGLVITFATSWLAYQNIVWTLATGAPDEVATVIAGTRGSATTAFAVRLDRIFTAISDASQQTPETVAATTSATAPGSPPTTTLGAPHNLLWISGLMLLVGTVGVLVTSKVALAALLALGPLFILFALFGATRGLFEGWLKAIVSFALVPLFTVVIGGGTLMLITPLVQSALLDSNEVATRGTVALFLAACVYCALMVMVVKVTGAIVANWRLPSSGQPRETTTPSPAPRDVGVPAAPTIVAAPVMAAAERVRAMVAALPAPVAETGGGAMQPARVRAIVAAAPALLPAPIATGNGDRRRIEGVGSRFRTPAAILPRGHVS